MKESIQLQIPTPCGEDWEHMQPMEKGRHCAHCCKTVVDFTEMSDEAILRYVTELPSGICGRLMPDQLGRKLAPTPVQRNGWSGWRWMIAGLVMVGKGSESRRAVKPPVELRAPGEVKDAGGALDGVKDLEGMIVRAVGTPTTIDSVPAVMGDTVIVEKRPRGLKGLVGIMKPRKRDSVRDSARMGEPAVDWITPPPAVIQPPPQREIVGYAGWISVGVCVEKTPIDTMTDILKKVMVDTLAALNILPKNELTVYPNPAVRGGAIQVAWSGEPGKYQLSLLNTRGALVQQRMLEVAGKGQVDRWELPVGLAAGVYFLRVVGEERANSYTREIMVR
jgi:hypothetical protein